MRNLSILWFASATAALWFASITTALAQQVVAPTPETVGNPQGENTSGYNIVNSFETGYRFRTH